MRYTWAWRNRLWWRNMRTGSWPKWVGSADPRYGIRGLGRADDASGQIAGPRLPLGAAACWTSSDVTVTS
jgi:hypothetical protein